MVRVRYIGDVSDEVSLIAGRTYRALGQNTHCYAVIDETGEDYLYPKELFVPADEESRRLIEENARDSMNDHP